MDTIDPSFDESVDPQGAGLLWKDLRNKEEEEIEHDQIAHSAFLKANAAAEASMATRSPISPLGRRSSPDSELPPSMDLIGMNNESDVIDGFSGLQLPLPLSLPGVDDISGLKFARARRPLSALRDQLTILATPEEERGWWYIDKKNAMQGPFGRPSMRQWFVEGHLDRELRVRFGSKNTNEPFHRITDLFFPSADAFADWGNVQRSARYMAASLVSALS